MGSYNGRTIEWAYLEPPNSCISQSRGQKYTLSNFAKWYLKYVKRVFKRTFLTDFRVICYSPHATGSLLGLLRQTDASTVVAAHRLLSSAMHSSDVVTGLAIP